MTLRIWVAVAAVLAAGSPIAAQEQQYPSRQIELVVPFPAGGGADVGARMVAQIASDSLGQPVVVQTKGGATGAIGSEYVARSTPDGYTLLLATGSTHAVLPAYRTDLPYDTVTSFAPATLVAMIPNMLVVNPKKVPVASVAELIKYLKDNPGKLNFASSGPGSSIHFAGELFKLMTRTEMTHVSYRGSAPALTDLLAGSVDLIFDNMPVVWPQVQQGNLRALGVATLERTPLAPRSRQSPRPCRASRRCPGSGSWRRPARRRRSSTRSPRPSAPRCCARRSAAGFRSSDTRRPATRRPRSRKSSATTAQSGSGSRARRTCRRSDAPALQAANGGYHVGHGRSKSARPCRLPADGLGREHRGQGAG